MKFLFLTQILTILQIFDKNNKKLVLSFKPKGSSLKIGEVPEGGRSMKKLRGGAFCKTIKRSNSYTVFFRL